jgi:hypothetical protein
MKTLLAAIAMSAVSLTGAAAPICGSAYAASCCKTCSAGKACGDSCISRSKSCHKGKGCACNG